MTSFVAIPVKRLLCFLFDHRWDHEDGFAKRACGRCGRREWLFQKRYPRVGEPLLSWQEMERPK